MSKSPESCKASIALRPTFFRTFTQVDNSLRHAASAVAASRARTRFASNQFGSDSVGDGKISCIVRVVDNVWFDFFFAALVLVNCVFIGILDAPLASFALLSVIVS